MEDKNLDSNPDNLDPITKEPGSHPVGTGIGSAGGAATGAGIGAVVAGPIGAVIGGAFGAVVGGAAGHAAGEAVNPTVEREFWSRNFQTRPYYKSGREYAEYEPRVPFSGGSPRAARSMRERSSPRSSPSCFATGTEAPARPTRGPMRGMRPTMRG